MRISGFKWCLVLLFWVVLSNGLHAQDSLLTKKYHVVFHHLRIDSALRLLEKQTQLHFTYNAAFVTPERWVDAQFEDVPLSIILDSIFQNPFFDYQIIQSQLVVIDQKEAKNARESLKDRSLQIAGKIVNARTGKPLAYASVSLKNKGLGIISNKEGNFVLHLPASSVADTLVVSHLGFFLEEVPVNAFKPFKQVNLREKVISLPEILIRTASAGMLVKKAIRRIDKNYDRKSFRMRAFYRESVAQNKKVQSYTEALLDIYKRARRPGLFGDQISLLKNRHYTDHALVDSLQIKLKGGLAAILQLDIIRNRPSFLLFRGLNDYEYAIQNMTLLDGCLAYVVHFQPKKELHEPGFEGELYINTENFAIVRAHFSYSKKSLKSLKKSFVVKRSKQIQSYPVQVEYTVGYQSVDGKYYIKHVLGDLAFKTKNRTLHKSYHHRVIFEMIRTDLNNRHPLRIEANKRLKINRIFADMLPGYDIGYWGEANIILPESNINQALRRFSQTINRK